MAQLVSAAAVGQPHGKRYGLSHLHICGRKTARGHILRIILIERHIGREYPHVALGAVKDDFLIRHTQTRHLSRRCVGRGKDVEYHREEERDIYRIEAAVERHRLDIYHGVEDVCAADTHADGVVDELLRRRADEYRQVGETILVSAAVIDTTRVDTDRLAV